MRGQATSIDMSSEMTKTPKSPKPESLEVQMVQITNNEHALSEQASYLLQPLVCLGSARPSTA
jgi:hypothetical protein